MTTSTADPLRPITSDTHPRLRARIHAQGYHYLVSQPSPAREIPGRRWPLLIFLHGAAERGSRVEDVARQGLPRLLTGAVELSAAELAIGATVADRFIVIAPQCAHYEVWDEPSLLALLDETMREFSVDAARVYLTGMSMGAFGAWTLGLRHPKRFAALLPICGGGRIADVRALEKNQPEALQSLGVWAFHGAQDRVVPVEESERMIAALERAHVADVKLTVYPEGGHDAWSATYSNPEIYSWLLTHAR